MDFSLTTLFVVPVGNTLPTTGSTESLTAGQFGIYKDEQRAAATAGNVGSALFIQFAQGRQAGNGYYMGSKISDKIKSTKVKKWYKVSAESDILNEVWEISNFTVDKGSSVTLSFRLFSSYIDTISFNGLTRSVTVPSDCLGCGESPCTDANNETIVNAILAKINAEDAAQVDPQAVKLKQFLSFEKFGTGASAKIRVSGKPLTRYGNPCDVSAFPWEYDRLWFRPFVSAGPDVTVDFITPDICSASATITPLQRSTYQKGSSDEIKQLEKDYYSYQSILKGLYREPGWNQDFESFVTDGTFYDTYVIKFDELQQDDSWTPAVKEDETVILAIPQGSTATIETILVTYFGAVTDKSGVNVTTTTTTSTTSTSTTSTTQFIP